MDGAEAARALLSAAAVRSRAAMMLDLARQDGLPHFRLVEERLPACAAFVAGVIRETYPDLNVPFHARWRHFEVDGIDYARAVTDALPADPARRTRALFDLAIVSVLLDAGAGARWRYRHAASGTTLGRSEGLALASLDAFRAGLFSSDPRDPLRADAGALEALTPAALGDAFQVSDENPLDGLAGRAGLLAALGRRIRSAPASFAGLDRPGGLYDRLAGEAGGEPLPAASILAAVLDALGPIWPGRLTLGGIGLGDTWRHPALRTGDAGDGLVPFHKLSQWLSYSLIEPLQWGGVPVAAIDGLTGLAEYRNGGLFLDAGVLALRAPDIAGQPLPPDHPAIVEWRALTVALLDLCAPLIRADLGLDAVRLPLASVLQGGTWAAGRRLAAERRAGGGPPLAIVSDGSVF